MPQISETPPGMAGLADSSFPGGNVREIRPSRLGAQAGSALPRHIAADGKLHRFSSDGRRGDDAGWYVFHAGDIPAGAFGCWRGGVSETWRADIGRELTAEEIAANRRKMDDDKCKRDAAEKKSRDGARVRAAKIWNSAAEAPSGSLSRQEGS
jgi:phage/plasmid primase-like uncharacterized protein